ncbi:MAG: pyridoxamine 5'-phosphate oxidase family protein [bacterium]|nr:pyridoxamine 5'-phosphate oxidase family protein [bacterium]
MDLRKLIEEYLKEAKLMQLATSVDGQPWACSVWFAADEDLNLYWFSSTTRRHSAEVVKNNKVAAAIVLPHTPADPARGLQLQGVAKLLTDQKDIDKAISVYADRIFTQEQILEFMNNPDRPHKFYRIKPTQFVLFDVVNFPENSRQELNLNNV